MIPEVFADEPQDEYMNFDNNSINANQTYDNSTYEVARAPLLPENVNLNKNNSSSIVTETTYDKSNRASRPNIRTSSSMKSESAYEMSTSEVSPAFLLPENANVTPLLSLMVNKVERLTRESGNSSIIKPSNDEKCD